MRLHKRIVLTLLICTGALLLRSAGQAADSQQLVKAFDTIQRAHLDTATTLKLDHFVLSHKDLRIKFLTGRIAFLSPVELNGDSLVFGAYFEGNGLFQFAPQTSMEADQLFRFFHTDSLDRPFSSITLLFSADVYDSIMAVAKPSTSPFTRREKEALAKSIAGLRATGGRNCFFETLRNLSTPIGGPFLFVNVVPPLTDRLYYRFDPYMREEVQLFKQSTSDVRSSMQLVCSYSQYIDSSYVSIDGLSKEQIAITHYDINSAVDRHGVYAGQAEVSFNVTRGPFQVLPLVLRSTMKVDSIIDKTGAHVLFRRPSVGESPSGACDLYFDSPLSYGDSMIVDFYYHGMMADTLLSDFLVSSGYDWYPRYSGYRQRAVFDLTFHSPLSYSVIASGNLIDQSEVEDTLISKWRVIPPAEDVSFSIGPFHTYRTEVQGTAKVAQLFSRRLHESIAEALDRKEVPPDSSVHQQVGTDVINSLKLFAHYFGPYPYRTLSLDELAGTSNSSDPALVHLGFDSWSRFDGYGKDRMSRIAEVAKQWWGVGVGYETYHDRWLSDGFAEYGALLYLQAAENNDKFIDRIREYRNDIFTSQKYAPGSGEEYGPIALGSRTASSDTARGDRLIVYKKGALVLHMLRNLLIDFKTMNEDAFFNMMSEFYQSNRGKDVSTADFQRLTEKYTGIKMDWFFRQFVYGNDLPTYDFSYDYEPDSSGSFIARGRIVTHGVSPGFKMYVPLEIQIDDTNRAYIRLFVDTSDYAFTLPALPRKPKKLVLNPFESVLAKVNTGP